MSHEKNTIHIKFDYFDFEEGIVLQLSHTGNSSNNIQVEGSFKGVKKIFNKSVNSNISLGKMRISLDRPIERGKVPITKIVGWAFIIAPILMTISVFLLKGTHKDTPSQSLLFGKIMLVILSLMYLNIMLPEIWTGN